MSWLSRKMKKIFGKGRGRSDDSASEGGSEAVTEGAESADLSGGYGNQAVLEQLTPDAEEVSVDLDAQSELDPTLEEDYELLPTPGPKYTHLAPRLAHYEGEFEDAKWRHASLNPLDGVGTRTHAFGDDERTAHAMSVGENGELRQSDAPMASHDGIFAMDAEGGLQGADIAHAQGQLDEGWLAHVEQTLGVTSEPDDTVEERIARVRDVFETLPEDEQAELAGDPALKRVFMHHASFFEGADVGAAGHYRTDEDGILKYLDAESGHHRPDLGHTTNALDELSSRGANLDHTRVGVHRRDRQGNVTNGKMEFQAGEVRAVQGHDETLQARDRMRRQVLDVGREARRDYGVEKKAKKAGRGGMSEEELRAQYDDHELLFERNSKGKLDVQAFGSEAPTAKQMRREARSANIDDGTVSPLYQQIAAKNRLRMEARRARYAKTPDQAPDFVARGETGSDVVSDPTVAPNGLAARGERYAGEQQDARWKGKNDYTVALSDAGRARRQVHVEDGRLRYGLDGRLMDTRGSKSGQMSDQTAQSHIFAMGANGDLLSSDVASETMALRQDYTDPATKSFHHSSFFGGRDLAGAGEMQVEDGFLTRMNQRSGHHKPSSKHTANVLGRLADQGANLDRARVDVMREDADGNADANDEHQFMAGEVLASGGDNRLLMGKKSFLEEIRERGSFSRKDRKTARVELALRARLREGATEAELEEAAAEAGCELERCDVETGEVTVVRAESASKRMLRSLRHGHDPKARYEGRTEGMFNEDAAENAAYTAERQKKARKVEKKEEKLAAAWKDGRPIQLGHVVDRPLKPPMPWRGDGAQETLSFGDDRALGNDTTEPTLEEDTTSELPFGNYTTSGPAPGNGTTPQAPLGKTPKALPKEEPIEDTELPLGNYTTSESPLEGDAIDAQLGDEDSSEDDDDGPILGNYATDGVTVGNYTYRS